jgi:integrase
MKRKAEIAARRKRIIEGKLLKAKTDAEKEALLKMGKEETSFATANRELALLKRVYNWYCEQHRLKLDNPVKGVVFFREKARDRVMTEEEEARFFKEGKPSPALRDIVLLALYTGMRSGEILKLEISDIVFAEIGGYISLKDTKNGDNRKVMLTKGLTEFLKRVIKDHGHGDYVITNPRIKEPYFGIKEQYRNACKRAGIDDLNFHDLKHTFCTRMSAAKVNQFVIMKIVGHKDPKTAQRYCNPTDENLMAAMQELGKKPLGKKHQKPEKKSLEFSLIEKQGSNIDEAENNKSKEYIGI